MREMMWVFAVIILSVCKAWSPNPGTSQSIYLTSNTSSTAPKVYVVRNSSFNQGSDANLTCSDKPWSEMIYIIWVIKLKNNDCKIAGSNDGQSTDSCNDGKSLQNTSRAQSYLHIPNFSHDDEGVYRCETVYAGGADTHMINVAITVPPKISAWLEGKGNKMVAVCKAERGKPAANISWSHTGSSSLETRPGSDGFFTVESRLEVPESMDTKNLNCTIRHPYWELERTLVPKPTKDLNFTLMCILMVTIIVVLVGLLFFAKKKTTMQRCCKQADTSPSKSPPTEDVEEVEPYASYVQRVNSIYNT